jgi:hypothetical protein
MPARPVPGCIEGPEISKEMDGWKYLINYSHVESYYPHWIAPDWLKQHRHVDIVFTSRHSVEVFGLDTPLEGYPDAAIFYKRTSKGIYITGNSRVYSNPVYRDGFRANYEALAGRYLLLEEGMTAQRLMFLLYEDPTKPPRRYCTLAQLRRISDWLDEEKRKVDRLLKGSPRRPERGRRHAKEVNADALPA